MDTPSSRDVLAGFIAEVGAGKHTVDSELAAVLLEHLLLQRGFKIVARQPSEQMLMASIRTTTPDEVWADMWDAAGAVTDDDTGYVPA